MYGNLRVGVLPTQTLPPAAYKTATTGTAVQVQGVTPTVLASDGTTAAYPSPIAGAPAVIGGVFLGDEWSIQLNIGTWTDGNLTLKIMESIDGGSFAQVAIGELDDGHNDGTGILNSDGTVTISDNTKKGVYFITYIGGADPAKSLRVDISAVSGSPATGVVLGVTICVSALLAEGNTPQGPAASW